VRVVPKVKRYEKDIVICLTFRLKTLKTLPTNSVFQLNRRQKSLNCQGIVNFIYPGDYVYSVDMSTRKGIKIKQSTFDKLIKTLNPKYGESVDSMVNTLIDFYQEKKSDGKDI